MKTIWKQMVWLLLGVVLVDADAQWVQEQVRLEPGWNAVYLTVQPEPANCDELLAGVPEVESVWRWNRRFTPVDFDVDSGRPANGSGCVVTVVIRRIIPTGRCAICMSYKGWWRT